MQRLEANIVNRIEVIDVLRGFALLGISLRHFISRFDYNGGVYSDNPFLYKIDKWIEAADYHFLLDKTYPIFALLFGFSMFLVNQSANERPFMRSFKRLLGLMPFACLNALFFPDGDILGVYMIVGFIVLLLTRLPLKWAPYIAGFFLLQPIAWIQILINLFNGNINLTALHSSILINDVNHTIANGSFLEIMWTNLTKGQLGNFLWAFEVGRVSQTIGLMLLGYYLGAGGRLVRFIEKGKKSLNYLWIPVLVIAGCIVLKKWAVETAVSKELLLVISNWYGLSFSFIYIILIIFIYNILPSHAFSSLRFYGRMSLTNYILQSIIGGILFAPFALNGAAYLTNVSIVLLFAVTTFIQIIFSKYWLSGNRYGPLEFYWRRLSLLVFNKSINF
ncbi:DUF418 domain-containing protein [Niabella aquatica]